MRKRTQIPSSIIRQDAYRRSGSTAPFLLWLEQQANIYRIKFRMQSVSGNQAQGFDHWLEKQKWA